MTVIDQTSSQTATETRPGGGQPMAPPAQWQRPGREQEINVGQRERAVSVAAGSIVALLGLSRRSIPGALIASLGGAMIYRGATGRCPAYESLGVDTAHGEGGGRLQGRTERGIHIATAFTINRPPEELYGFWRNFENLPRIMTHLDSVKTLEGGRSHWVARMESMGGKRMEWDAEITRDEPNKLISWRSLPGADVENVGQVRFQPGLGDRGTEVHVEMDYMPPAGRLGHWIASLSGDNPKRVIREDLRNFKRLMEIGEILTIIGQPHGTCTGQGKPYTESRWKPLFT
ncbi:MAG: cyclase/dehydrase [Phycisphaerales bacterium]|nr:cyclase/dehydrase [Phycisphaerales bacterium]